MPALANADPAHAIDAAVLAGFCIYCGVARAAFGTS